jgi:hypothetical protein
MGEACHFEYNINDSARVLGAAPGNHWVKSEFIETKALQYNREVPMFDSGGSLQDAMSSLVFIEAE